jgi:hypothetical protein
MSKKFVCYVTYGVYVDTDDDIDLEHEPDWAKVSVLAVEKMWSHGLAEVSNTAEVEIEDVTEEFEEN